MKKCRFLWSAHRITERQKAGKSRSIKGKQLKNSRSTVSRQPVALRSSPSADFTQICNQHTSKSRKTSVFRDFLLLLRSGVRTTFLLPHPQGTVRTSPWPISRSARSGRPDRDEKVYIIFTAEDSVDATGCAGQKAGMLPGLGAGLTPPADFGSRCQKCLSGSFLPHICMVK